MIKEPIFMQYLKETILLLIATITIGYAQQNSIASLKEELLQVDNPQQELKLLDSLSDLMLSNNHKELDVYIQKTIRLAQEQKNNDILIKKLEGAQRHYEVGGQQIDQAFIFKQIDELLNNSSALNSEVHKAHVNYLKGRSLYAKSQPVDEILKYLKQAVNHLDEANLQAHKLYPQINYVISTIASEKGDIIMALDYSEKAADFFLKRKDTIMWNTALSVQADLMSKNGLFGEAKKIRDKIYHNAEAINDDYLLVYLKINEGVDYDMQGNKEANLASLAQALPAAERLKPTYPVMSAMLFSRLASLYATKGELERVDEFFEKLQEVPFNENLSHEYLTAKSEYHAHKKEIDSALHYAKASFDLVKDGELAYKLYENNNLLSSIYEKAGDYKKALILSKEANTIKDSLNTVIKGNAFSYYQTLYETEKKEKNIQQLENQNALKSSRNKTLSALLFSLFLLLIIVVYAFRINSKKKAAKLKQSVQILDQFKQLLTRRAEEKEVLRVKLSDLEAKLNEKIEIESIEELMTSKILTKDDWLDFKKSFNQVYPNFFRGLQSKGVKLTEGEERLIALEKLELKTKEIASALGIAEKSVRMSRYRLKKKVGLGTEELLQDFLEVI